MTKWLIAAVRKKYKYTLQDSCHEFACNTVIPSSVEYKKSLQIIACFIFHLKL